MKNYSSPFIVAVLISWLLTNCTKEPIPVLKKPRLLITIKDDAGKAVAGATVRLYKYTIDTCLTKISDTTGYVIFADLDIANYHWLAEKGCFTNRISQTTLNRNTVPDVMLYGYSVMAQTGALKIINNATEAYKVSDSLINLNVQKDTPYIAFRRVKSYLIHSEKLSTPGIGKDTLIQIRCGDTTILQLPY